LGAAWVVAQPLASLAVFSLVFRKVIRVPSENVPYPVFCFAALLLWQAFSAIISGVSTSMLGNSHLLSKVYVPRLALPIATVLPALADFAISLLVLAGMMAWYGVAPGWTALWVPAILLIPIGTAWGAGLILAAYNVEHRDVRHFLPVCLQFLVLASPIAYPASLVPEGWRVVFSLNPLAGAIEGFRWALLGTTAPPPRDLVLAAVVTLALVGGGIVCFRLREAGFADQV
jgi:lipopolysaccharide transport system permease protein